MKYVQTGAGHLPLQDFPGQPDPGLELTQHSNKLGEMGECQTAVLAARQLPDLQPETCGWTSLLVDWTRRHESSVGNRSTSSGRVVAGRLPPGSATGDASGSDMETYREVGRGSGAGLATAL